MTQKIQLPNGDTLEFPDDMPDDAIAKAIADNYPEYGPKASAAAPAAAAPAAAPAKPAPTPAAPAPVSSGGLLDAIGDWYGKAKQAIIDVPKLAPGQQAGQPDPNADPLDVMANTKGGPDMSDLPVTPEYLRAMQAQWNAATPSQRRELAARKDHMGVVARRLNEARPKLAADEAPDTLGINGNKGVQLDTTSALDMLDPTAEARTRRLIRGGVRGDLAADTARVAAARDIPLGAEAGLQSSASVSDFDFATFKKYNEDPFWKNPAVRGAVKGYEGYKQGILGLNQAIGEVVGADVSGQAALAKESRGFTEAMGESPDYLQRNFEGTISSIAQQLPSLIGGAITGSEGLVLGSMFAQSFGQEYSDGRAKGQAQGAALTRAGLFGAFEVVGEKLGLGERLDLMRNAARGVETNVLAKWMANTLTNELPGEMLTTTGQFLTDKLPAIGTGQNAGLADYLQQMGDTVTQTIMQGGLMSAGTGGVNHARRYLNGALDRSAEHDANAAQRDALNAWNTNGLSPNSRVGGSAWANAVSSPAARREPSLGDIAAATTVDDAIAAAEAVAGAPASAPAPTIAGIDPATLPNAADIDALEQQAEQLASGKPLEKTPPANLPAGPEAAPAAGFAGKESDDTSDWHPFPPESRTLGVPRAQMPQIKAEHRGAMVNFLNARGISHEQVEVAADDLKPTQREFSPAKVDKALEYQGGNRSILISSDNYVLDGHHQWMAAAVNGEPVQAIRLNAPIKQLVKTVHEFPSSTVDTSSEPQQGLGQGARIGQTALDANAQRIQKQEDAVKAAADNLAKRKTTGGERARERLKKENPFLGFLASHGVQIDERSDTGGEKGKGVMVPGYGPIYRKGGKRIDELAGLAHEAGFLSDQDMADPTDNGGTRKLADMIQRAAHGKEVIRPAGLLDAIAPTADQRLIREAQRLGIETEGKTADQLYDAVRAAHDAEEGRRETSGASSIDEQDQIDQLAEQIPPQQLADADIPLDLNDPRLAPDHDLTDEEIDAIFGIQKAAGPRADRGETEGDAAETAHEGAAPAGQRSEEGQDLLTSYSPAEVVAREEEAAARAKAVQAERDRLEAQRKKEQDAKEARARADATVDDFQLGQDPMAQLSGQRGMFDEPAPAEPKRLYGLKNVTAGSAKQTKADMAMAKSWGYTEENVPLMKVDAGWMIAGSFKDIEQKVVDYRHDGVHFKILVAQAPNGKWAVGVHYFAPGGSSYPPMFTSEKYDSRDDAVRGGADKIKEYLAYVPGINQMVDGAVIGETSAAGEKIASAPQESIGETGTAGREFATVTQGPTAQRLLLEDSKVFAQPRIHRYNPQEARPVVFISCSDAKLEGGPHRAIDLYQGALFDVLRKWMPTTNRPDVFIISAQHGLVHADTLLENYEQPMTQERLEALMKKGIAAAQIVNRDFSQVFIAGSANYRELGQTYAERFRKAGFLAPDAKVLGSAAGAGIGTQRGDLADYLKGLEAAGTPETKQLADKLDANLARTKAGDEMHRLVGDEMTASERLKKEIERAKKGGKHENATAPEHLAGVDDRELGEIVAEFNEAQAEMMQDGHPISNVFAPPKKHEIVRLKNKALATGLMWDEKESGPYLKDVEELEKLDKENERLKKKGKKLKPIPAGIRERIAAFEVDYLPHAEKLKKAADIEVGKWIAHAQAQGMNEEQRRANSKKVVLSFFDLSGEWSKPWVEAGYEVHRFDIQADPEMGDVNNFSTEFFTDWFGNFDGKEVYAILAATPCTDFASSGSRHFAAKDADGRTVASVKLVHQTLRAIEYFKPSIWALENPVGRIEKLGGLPPWRLSFDPNHLGDTYTKKTMIWGRFNADLPVAPVEPVEGSKMWRLYGGKSMATKNARSETPPGFSYGFFMANNAVDHPAMAIHGQFDRLDRGLIEQAVDLGVTADEITSAVDDHYYMDLDDDAANEAIRELIADAKKAGKVASNPAKSASGSGKSESKPGKAASEPAIDISQIPLDFYKGVTVDYLAVAGADATQLPADEALAKTREDIDRLEAMLKCMGN